MSAAPIRNNPFGARPQLALAYPLTHGARYPEVGNSFVEVSRFISAVETICIDTVNDIIEFDAMGEPDILVDVRIKVSDDEFNKLFRRQ